MEILPVSASSLVLAGFLFYSLDAAHHTDDTFEVGDVAALGVDDPLETGDFFAKLGKTGLIIIAHGVVTPICLVHEASVESIAHSLVFKGEVLFLPVPGTEKEVADSDLKDFGNS